MLERQNGIICKEEIQTCREDDVAGYHGEDWA